MDQVIIGNAPATNYNVITEMRNSGSFDSLQTKWKTFGTNLGVSDSFPSISLRLSGLMQLEDVPKELIDIWKARNGSGATLLVLYKALVDSGLKGIADFLRIKFCPAYERQIKYIIRDIDRSLEDLMDPVDDSIYQQIYQAVKKDKRYGLPIQPIQLIRDQIFPAVPPSYYISRNVVHKTRIDEKIFLDSLTKDHIFLVKGIDKQKLAEIVNYQPVDMSGNQIHGMNVRYMVLECDDDYERIRLQAFEPVHWITFQDNAYFWCKSSRSLDMIQKFITNEAESINEERFIKAVEKIHAVSLSGFQGIGKSSFLAKLAYQTLSTSLVTIPLCAEFDTFLQQIPDDVNSKDSAIKAMAEFICGGDPSTKIVLENMLNMNKYRFEFYLDAYDEVNPEKLGKADQLLQHIKKIPNVKLYITTRPHMRERLESILGIISYEMLPFNEDNQVEFLWRYWYNKNPNANILNLQHYANTFLTTLNSKMKSTDKDKSLAEIPLYCKMIAEVYGSDAERPTQISDVVTISVFDLYKSLVDSKLKGNTEAVSRGRRSLKTATKNCINAHIYYGIALLFPKWVDRLKGMLKGYKDVKNDVLYSVGLMEQKRYSNSPTFIHKTVAEYLVADFILKHLKESTACVNLMFTVILGKENLKKFILQGGPPIYRMDYSVIAYFMDCFLNKYQSTEIDQILVPALKRNKYDKENFCLAMTGICCEDMESYFGLLGKILQHVLTSKQNMTRLQDKYFKYLPHMAVEFSSSYIFPKDVLSLLQNVFNVELNYFDYEAVSKDGYKFPWILNSTPLHVALYFGKFNTATELRNLYGQDIQHLKYLLHMCVRDSAQNEEEVIKDKILLIDMFTQLSITFGVNWLEEKFGNSECTPLLQINVHFEIIKKLVALGAHILATSKEYGTILHQATDKETCRKLLKEIIPDDFANINFPNSLGLTPLQSAIDRFGALDEDMLQLFQQRKSNFNANDNKLNSVLFYAIGTGQTEFIGRILGYETNVNHLNEDGNNAAHIVLQYAKKSNWAVDNVMNLLSFLIANKFLNLDNPNFKGVTPLQAAMLLDRLDVKLVEWFLSKKVDVNAVDKTGDSVLFHAIKQIQNPLIIKELMEFGADGFYHNLQNQNVLHVCVGNGNFRAFMFFQDSYRKLSFKSQREQDVNGNLPIHLLFRRKADQNRDILTRTNILKHGFNVENKAGNVPFVEWIKNGRNSLPILVDVKNELTITPEMALKALDVLVDDENLQFYIIQSTDSDKNIFVEMLYFLLAKSGVLTIENGICFELGGKNNGDSKKSDEDSITRIKKLRDRINDVIMKNTLLRTYLIEMEAKSKSNGSLGRQFKSWTNYIVQKCRYEYLSVSSLFQEPSRDTEFDLMSTPSFIPNYTKFHEALYTGDYTMACHLLEQVGEAVNKIKYVMHACVYGSSNDDDSIIKDKIKILKFLATKNPSWLEETLDGSTALLQPKVHSKLLQELVSLGADINACSARGTVLFQTHCGCPYNDLAQWAISNGFNKINQRNLETGRTAIMHAINEIGRLDDDVMDSFMKVGLDINAFDKGGNSVLFYALKNGNIDFAKKVLNCGADANHENEDQVNAGHVVISMAIRNAESFDSKKALQMLDLLVSKRFTGIDKADSNGDTSLLLSMQLRDLNLSIIEFFAARQADFNRRDGMDNSVLFKAIICNQNSQIINKILEYGADLQYVNSNKQNALHVAVSVGNLSALEYLVEKLDINSVDINGNTPLHLLFSDEDSTAHGSILNRLLQKGANLDAKNKFACVPLVRWIQEGEHPLPTLVKLKNSLQVTPEIASKALTTLICRTKLLSKHLINSSDEDKRILGDIINFLISKKAVLLSLGKSLTWDNLDHETLENFQTIQLNSDFQDEISKLNDTDDILPGSQFPSNLLSSIQSRRSLSIVFVLSTMLRCKMYDEFMQLSSSLCQKLVQPQKIGIINIDELKDIPWIPNRTLLHRIVRSGNFPLTKQLIKEKGEEEVSNINFLLHACVRDTAQSKQEMESFRKIIDLLIEINPDCLEEKLDGYIPLLQEGVHYQLIQHLVRSGTDINSISENGETILHRVTELATYVDLLPWAASNGFNHINHGDSRGYTPLIYAISKFKTLRRKELEAFSRYGADFNAVDNQRYSVLFHALLRSNNMFFIRKTIECGADVNYTTPTNLTAAHMIFMAAEARNSSSRKMWCKLKLILFFGFRHINLGDENGVTPLHMAVMEGKTPEGKLLDVFHEAGANFNATDNVGHSILFYAIEGGQDRSITSMISEWGRKCSDNAVITVRDDGDINVN